MRASTSWPHVLVLFLAGVAVALQIGKVPGAIPLLKHDLDLGLVAAGWVVSIFSLIAACGGVAFGAAADRFGHGRVALFGMCLSAAAAVAGAFAPGPLIVLLTRALEGFGFILTSVSIPPLIAASTTPRDRDVAMGLWGAYMPMGTGGMLLFGAPLLGLAGWRGLWLITAALILMAAPFVHRAARAAGAKVHGVARPSFGEMANVVRRPGPLLLSLAFAFYAAQFLAVMGFLPLILVERNGLAPSLAAGLAAIAVISNVVGNMIAGVALRHGLRAPALMIFASACMAAGAWLVFMDDSDIVMRVAGGILFSGAGGLIPGSLFAQAPLYAPRPQLLASVNGMMMQGAALGQLAGPPAAAVLAAHAGSWSAVAPVSAAAAGLVAVFSLLLRRLQAVTAAAAASAE